MRTRTGSLFLVLSLLTALACAVWWWRSYSRSECVLLFGGRAGTAAAAACEGAFVVCVANVDFGPERAFTLHGFTTGREFMAVSRNRLAAGADRSAAGWGFTAAAGDRAEFGLPDGRYAMLVVPFWFPLAASLPAPALWARRTLRAARRARRGLCPDCGYDLRATTSGRCPECGRAVTAPSTRRPGTGGS